MALTLACSKCLF